MNTKVFYQSVEEQQGDRVKPSCPTSDWTVVPLEFDAVDDVLLDEVLPSHAVVKDMSSDEDEVLEA